MASCTTSAPDARAQRAETPQSRNLASATFFACCTKFMQPAPPADPDHARTPGPWEDDGKIHHGPASLPSGKNQTRHLDALDAADKTAAYEGGGGGGGATIIFRVGAVKCCGPYVGQELSRRAHVADISCVRRASAVYSTILEFVRTVTSRMLIFPRLS